MSDGTKAEPRLTPKGQETRRRILAAAADLILKHGVAGTQIDDVRRSAGVSGSQMTHYFRDKHTLIQDVIAWQAGNTLADHRHPDLGRLDSIQAWHRWAEMIVERQTGRGFQGGCEFGSLAGQLVESEPDLRPDLAAGYEQWLELFRTGLRLMHDRGELVPEADPDALAGALLAALQGGLLLAQTLRRVDPLRDSLQAAVAHLESFAAGADGGRRGVAWTPTS
jgi:TetR/AcrR family transcriptional regulator, transcriptional repressor for nem operon